MVAKLKLILKPVPWFLLLRAAIFGASWLVLPFWLFFALCLYFYFVPLFQPAKLALPFLLTVGFAAVLTPSAWTVLVLSLIFFFVLGIKDLIIVRREVAYEALVFLLLFLIFFQFFQWFDMWGKPWALAGTLAVGFLFFLLTRGLFGYAEEPEGTRETMRLGRRRRILLFSLGAFLVWQLTLAALFLPLNFFYQTALLFLAATLLIEYFKDYLGGMLTRERLLFNLGLFVALAVVIFISAHWRVK